MYEEYPALAPLAAEHNEQAETLEKLIEQVDEVAISDPLWQPLYEKLVQRARARRTREAIFPAGQAEFGGQTDAPCERAPEAEGPLAERGLQGLREKRRTTMESAESMGETRPWWGTRGASEYRRLPADADSIVIGAGIAGLSVAYHLLEAGHSVVVLDKRGAGAGETGRSTAHLCDALDDRYLLLERMHGMEGARAARRKPSRRDREHRAHRDRGAHRLRVSLPDGHRLFEANACAPPAYSRPNARQRGAPVCASSSRSGRLCRADQQRGRLEVRPPGADRPAGLCAWLLTAAIERRGGRIHTDCLVRRYRAGLARAGKRGSMTAVFVQGHHIIVANGHPHQRSLRHSHQTGGLPLLRRRLSSPSRPAAQGPLLGYR